jgi:hypothetical protein
MNCYFDAHQVSLQSSLLAMIQKIAWYNISLRELTKYLQLMTAEFPTSVLETFILMAKRKITPTYYADFSKKYLNHCTTD